MKLAQHLGNKTICFLLIVLLGTVTFLPLLNAGFIHLDDRLLLGTDFVDNFDIPKMFSFESAKDTISVYIPLTSLSFAVEKKLGPSVAWRYHFHNIILHFLVTLLVFFVARIFCPFSVRAALITALLFCIHPIHLESFAWVSERKDVLYSSFYLGSILLYLYYLKTNKGTPYLLSLLLGILSVLAKPMALSLPLILFLIDWYARRDLSWKLILEKIPFFLFISSFALITFLGNVKASFTLESPLIWIWCLTWYIRKFFLPFELGHAYPLPEPVSLSNPEYILAFVILICIGFMLWTFRKRRLLIFAFSFYFLSIFFLLRFDTKDFHLVADRYMYLSSFGFCLLSAYWIEYALQRYKITLVLLVLLIAQLAVKTNQMTASWDNSYSFWESAVNSRTDESYFYRNLGERLFKAGNYDGAIIHFNKAIELIEKHRRVDSSLAEERIYLSRGDCYLFTEKYVLAVKDLTRALELYNGERLGDRKLLYKIYSHVSSAMVLNQQYKEAIPYLLQAIQMEQEAWVVNNLGAAYENIGRPYSAKFQYEKAALLDPTYERAVNNLERLKDI